MRKYLLAMAVLASLVTASGVVYANNKWKGYHWRSDNLAIATNNQVTSSFYGIPAALNDWEAITPDGGPAFTGGAPVELTIREIVSTSDPEYNPFWLGIARVRVFLDTKHILEAEVVLNTVDLTPLGALAAEHVGCQEIGHILGLDHNRDGKKGGTPDDSCMNDRGHLGEFTDPNDHDEDQLAGIYGHDDDASGGGKGGGKGGNGGNGGNGGGPDCSEKPNHPKCSGQTEWITVHVFPAPN